MTPLAGRYQLAEQIQRGGMGTVYRGIDTVLNRPVAIKVLSGTFARDPGFVERFEREARNAARLSHPSVVSVFDAGSEGDTHFIVMELVEGQTLADLIRTQGPLLPDRAARIAADVAEALAAAHAVGIVHRDVKPANVLLTRDGSVKVADFGIARAADSASTTQTGTLLGTAAYVSPEQALGLPAGPRSDLYALGCVLFEMLTRRPPFEGETQVATLYRHINDPVPAPSSLRPVPPQLDAIVVRCLAKDPSDRPDAAADLRRELLASVEHPRPSDTMILEPVSEPTLAFGPDADEPGRSRPQPWWATPSAILVGGLLLVALLTLLVVAATGGTDGSGRGRDVADRQPTVERSQEPSPDEAASEEPTTGESAPPTELGVEDAYGLFVAAIEAQAHEDDVDEKVAEDLLDAAEEIGEALEEGDLSDALKKIAEFQKKLEDRVEKGELSTLDGQAIDEALRILAQTVIAAGGTQEDD